MMTRIPAFALLIVLSAACGQGSLDQVDPQAAPERPTWALHVGPIVKARCAACHGQDSWGGPAEGELYETCGQVRRGWGEFAETSIDSASMPPGGAPRLTSAEILTLERWASQGRRCD